jgi:hypothetical protein
VALAKADRKLIFGTGGILILAALFFASVLVFATGGGHHVPSDKQGPLYIGPKPQLVETLDQGSPLYFANPFGGRGFWLDREQGQLIALDVGLPSDTSCSIKWKGRINTYTDCRGGHLTKDDMARHPVSVVQSGKQKGSVYVDLRKLQPAPNASDAG